MPSIYGTISPPPLGNVYLDALVGPGVYDLSAFSRPLTYVLQGKPGSSGMNGLGGTLWSANGAATAFVEALDAWEAVCNIQVESYPFYYNGSGGTSANWVEQLDALGSETSELGHHELPVPGMFATTLQLNGGFNSQSVVFKRENNASGGYSFTTFLHEIGHALGLDHPHSSGTFPGVTSESSLGNFSLNQGIYTVMSYNDGYAAKGMSPSYAYGWMSTPGAWDIAVVQALYGANMSSHAGDDVYTLSTINAAGTGYACIWDAGGNDTISAEAAMISCRIDLREATLAQDAGGGGWLSSASGIYGGFTIANGVVIENAIGGTNADSIEGNSHNNVLRGLAGNDIIVGNGGDDVLDGGVGNDALSGGQGSDLILGGDGSDTIFALGDGDTIDGGLGTDLLNFGGLTRSYNAVFGYGDAVVGDDTVTGVETIAFRDAVLTFDENSDAAFVMRMYDTVLRRTPDPAGLDSWLDAMDHGTTRAQVAKGFLGSQEFALVTGSLSTPDYVEYLYNHALGRASDPSGKAGWVNYIDSGTMSRADVLMGFSESQEHKNLTAGTLNQGLWHTNDNFQQIEALYDSFADRLPDQAGLLGWADLMDRGMTLKQVATGFAGSAEFAARTTGMSNANLVEYMYNTTLDRPSDAVGKAYWVDQLDHGMSKGDLLLGFSSSLEHFLQLQEHLYSGVDFHIV